MTNNAKKITKIILIILALPIVLFVIFLLYATLADYNPKEEIVVYESKESDGLKSDMEINIMTWNIGYCGLGADMDFFYDGGEQVRTSEENTQKNLEAVKLFLKEESKNIDFFLIQEVDIKAKRSYKIDQHEEIKKTLSDYKVFFGINYKVFFVPTPPTKPYGKVLAGLATYSKYTPSKSTRFPFPGNYSWPMGLFMLDRCFLENRYNLDNGKELIIINTHNSAYDDGTLKQQQNEYLKKHILKEYQNGNYVIVGGDWNQCPPNFKPDFDGFLMDNEVRTDIASDYLIDWKWVFQNKVPSNRRVSAIYDKSKTLTTMIDFFVVSPNVEEISVQGIDLNFQNSDHNPVIAKLKLIN